MATQKTVKVMKDEFERADSLEKAVGLIRDAGIVHGSYAHYTSLKSLLSLIENRQWWLTRATASGVDDLIESRKYGNKKALKNLFFVSFSYSHSESAAMWRLYSECDENAARVSLTKTALVNWLKAIKLQKVAYSVSDGRVHKSKSVAIEDAFVHDVIYASVEDEGEGRSRAKSLCWNDCFTKSLADLRAKKSLAAASGVLKDYEWRFEYESRLIVKIADDPGVEEDRIAVEIPKEVLALMKFTRSPWIQYEQEIQRRLRESIGSMLSKQNVSVPPSVLTGALEKWASRRER